MPGPGLHFAFIEAFIPWKDDHVIRTLLISSYHLENHIILFFNYLDNSKKKRFLTCKWKMIKIMKWSSLIVWTQAPFKWQWIKFRYGFFTNYCKSFYCKIMTCSTKDIREQKSCYIGFHVFIAFGKYTGCFMYI